MIINPRFPVLNLISQAFILVFFLLDEQSGIYYFVTKSKINSNDE